MFSIFKKKTNINDEDLNFLTAIIQKLPSSYHYLLKQINKDFLIGKEKSPSEDFTYDLLLNAKLETAYQNLSLPRYFIIKDILVWQKVDNIFVPVDLHIVEGRLSGFKVEVKYNKLDLNRIETKSIYEKHFMQEDKKKLLKILGDIDTKITGLLDLDDTFMIEVENTEYFVIKNLGNGAYISITNNGSVYGMIHDPYEIELIYKSKDQFYEDLKSGTFDFANYYDSKFQ